MSRQKRLEKAQMRVLFQVPFFAPGVAKLPVVWDDTIDTACTDGKEIRWSGKWFDSLPDECLPTVLCHEVAHCLLGHLWRAPQGCDWQRWNIATDHAINLMLKEFSQQVMAKRLADPFPFPDPQDAYCADPAYAGLAEEVIYARLPKGKGGGGGGAGKGGAGGKGGKPAPGSMPSFGQMKQPGQAGQSSVEQKKLANDWDGTLINSAKIMESQQKGDLPSSLQRFVEGLVKPVVPWWQILRSLIREQCSDDWNFLEPAIEFSGSGFLLPSLKSERMGPVVFATDTSGSIDHDLLRQFQSEKQNCLDDMRPSKVVDIYCDAKIHKVAEYGPGDTIGKEAPGGGGTDFRPVFEHLEKMDQPPKCIVYLTDLYGSFPEASPCPCIWVTWSKDIEVPFGEVVYAGK